MMCSSLLKRAEYRALTGVRGSAGAVQRARSQPRGGRGEGRALDTLRPTCAAPHRHEQNNLQPQ